MKSPAYYRKRQLSAVFVALLLFQLILILLQLWLFVSVLEGLLSMSRAWPYPPRS